MGTTHEKIEQVLIRHFDEQQKSSGRRSLSIQARVREIWEAIDEIELQAKVADIQLSEDLDNTINNAPLKDVNEIIASTLIHFIDCSLITEVSPDTKESVEIIQELAVAVASQRVEVARSVLQNRLIALSVVLLERVRSTACRCIGWIVKYLVESVSIAKEDLDELLDTASQTLLPRFTDKTQVVRQSAIEASRFFFGNVVGRTNNKEMDDPDVRQSLQWSLQHDPSVTNRLSALESLPLTIQTMDVVLTRVRDVKPKVRVAAIQTLQDKLPTLQHWEAEQCAELVESGWTERCAATKVAVERIVLTWVKSCGFDVMALLRHLDVLNFENSCRKVMSILTGVQDEFLDDNFSERDVGAFQRGMKQASKKLVLKNQTLEAEQVFLLRCQCEHAEKLEPRKKEMILSEIMPDIPEVCAMFELHASALMKAISEEKGEDTIDRLVSICLHLLSMVKSAEVEEGSRLHLKTTLKGMLESIVLPDDLVEGSVETLYRIHRDEMDFWETCLSTVETLDGQDHEDGLFDNRLLRILSILCTLFEKSSSRLASSEVLDSFVRYVLPAVSHENALIREAGVNCLGKAGLFTKPDRILSEFKPILLDRAQDEDEKLSIRAQALLGLSDWSILFGNEELSIQSTLLEIMNHKEVSLACVAAEATSKLLYHGKFFNKSCMGTLLVLFFDPRLSTAEEDDENDVEEVGSPIRLQQLLTQFFLLFCLRGENGRENFVSCTSSALDIVLSKDGGKRKRGTKAFPIAKMIEFLTSTADEAKRIQNENKGQENGTITGSSTDLLVSIQIAKFLTGNTDDLNVTTLRLLCKILGATEINPEIDESKDLRELMERTEDLGNLLTDDTCLHCLESLNETLEAVELPNESTLPQDDEESLNDAMERVHITPSRAPVDKENSAVKGQNTADKRDSLGSLSVRPSRLSMSSVNEA
jgi:condensin complex subunit 3